ncbi:hypothetical protein N7510_003815 [Penicillium lagena]|uniref:uncharacterized protein n=1 Tax=Penicillium lagena TaxID=94218 RepID=UPI002540D74B|nr:uncharacterized protein N7510_003815 [Penicillium lagena]KAJ5619831.1 hypothetical protein N7510_003815 [Penicillium lagena]
MKLLRWLTLERPQKRLAYEKVPTDMIMPVHYFDDTTLLRNSVQCWSLRFNDVLDPEMLRASLSQLLEREGWCKLGGRIRLNTKQELEIHVPQAFTSDRPAVNFHHDVLHVSISEHPLASRLPAPTSDTPSVHNGPSVFRELAVTPSTPVCLDDYLNSDLPQLTLNVVSFTDATLVSLCWPHIAADAMSLRDVAMAWSLVLAGRESEIPPMLSSRYDPMVTAGKDLSFQQTHVLEEQQIKGWWSFLWSLRFVFDLLWWRKMETRTVFLPRKVVEQLRSNALASLAQKAANEVTTEGQAVFISEGDVVTAWMSMVAASALLPLKSSRAVCISNAFDLRSRLPSIFPTKEKQGTYVQNAVFPCWTIIMAREIIGKTDALGVAALQIRRSIKTQTTEDQIHALARLTRLSLDQTGLPPMFGDTSSFLITASNWSKARFFDIVNFGPAVQLKQRALKNQGYTLAKDREYVWRTTKPVRQATESNPVYYHVDSVSLNNMLARNAFFVTGTPNGDYWINGCFPIAVWNAVEGILSENFVLY